MNRRQKKKLEKKNLKKIAVKFYHKLNNDGDYRVGILSGVSISKGTPNEWNV